MAYPEIFNYILKSWALWGPLISEAALFFYENTEEGDWERQIRMDMWPIRPAEWTGSPQEPKPPSIFTPVRVEEGTFGCLVDWKILITSI